MRRHFARRVFLGVAVFLLLIFAANVLAVAMFSGFGRHGHRGFGPVVAVLGFGLIVALVAAGRAVRRLAGPVGALMEAADRVAAGDYRARVPERGPREMRRLTRSFNAMTQRLQAHEEQRKNLLADVAHELRTPLSVIQGNAEGMLDGLYPVDRAHLVPLLDEAKVMSRLLDTCTRSRRPRRECFACTGSRPIRERWWPTRRMHFERAPRRRGCHSKPAWHRTSRPWMWTQPGSARCWPTCCPTPCATLLLADPW